MKKIFFFITALFALVMWGSAQNTFPANGAVGIGTLAPNGSSLLHINSTSKGLLIPRMTQAQRNAIAAPATGLLVFQTDVNPTFYWYTGSIWKTVGGAARDLANLVNTTAVNVHLLPNATGVRDLGSAAKKWRNGYFSGTVSAGNISASAPGTAVYGNSTYLGVYGTGGTYGVYGSGTSYGVYGTSSSGYGIRGVSSSSYGVYGSGTRGVYGSGSAYGLYGAGGTYGVYGNGTGYGVYGSSSNGYGIRGLSSYSYGVYGSGSVGVYGSGSSYGLYGTGGSYGVYGNGSAYGVYGNSSSNYGIRGVTSTGIGVYGTAGGATGYGGYFVSSAYRGIYVSSNGTGYYAGYFAGDIYTTGSYLSSDARLKKNIKDFSNAMDIINRLQPKNYEFRDDGNYATMGLPKGNHYGLLAQDLEKVLPNLVKEEAHEFVNPVKEVKPLAEGEVPAAIAPGGEKDVKESINVKAVNYIELIPIMVKAMQELSSKNEQLQSQVNELKSLISRGGNNTAVTSSTAFLKQNAPNPFNNNTIIGYYIPDNEGYAQIKVTDIKGSVIKTFNAAKGEGQINIRSSELPAGTYNYSLHINNRTVDTKQMVLVK